MLEKIEITSDRFPLQDSEDPYLKALGSLLGAKLRGIISMETFEREQLVLMFKYNVMDDFAIRKTPLPPDSHIGYQILTDKEKRELPEDKKERVKKQYDAWQKAFREVQFANLSGLEWLHHWLHVARINNMVMEQTHIEMLIRDYT